MIINDSGVDYAFLQNDKCWLGEVVEGDTSTHIEGCITIQKPFGLNGTYTADASHFIEVKNERS